MTRALHWVVPAPLHRRTGGSLYDARMIGELRALGHPVTVHEVAGAFPVAEPATEAALDAALAAVPAGALAIVDGLCLGGAPETAARHGARLCLIALVHHPLGDETGLAAAERDRLLACETHALRHCSAVVTTSAFTADRLRALGMASAARPVPPGCPPPPAPPGAPPGGPPELLCVASLVPRKGQDLLVEALATIRDRPWHCRLVGEHRTDPAFTERVRGAIRRTGLGERIRLQGACDDTALEAAYARAALFVLPSWYEGYGMVLTEAMARGLAVVSTRGGAIPHTVPAEAGLLVPPGDPGALAGALAALLDAPRRRAAMGETARRHAATLDDWPATARAFAAAVEGPA